jgi:hypothetical protein
MRVSECSLTDVCLCRFFLHTVVDKEALVGKVRVTGRFCV